MSKIGKKIMTMIMIGILTLGAVLPVSADKVDPVKVKELVITDIPADAWYRDAIIELAEKGILQGNKGLIKPNANITRAEYVQMLYNIMGDKWEKNIHPDLLPGSMDDIDDVKESDWFFKQIRIAMMNGIIKDGYDGKLRPNATLTREEMFVMTVRAFNLEHWESPEGPEDKAKNFKDESDISSWSRDSINFLLEGSFIKGNHENKLLPKKNITRAEASMVIRAMDKVKELKPGTSVGQKPIEKPTEKPSEKPVEKPGKVWVDEVGHFEDVYEKQLVSNRVIIRHPDKYEIIETYEYYFPEHDKTFYNKEDTLAFQKECLRNGLPNNFQVITIKNKGKLIKPAWDEVVKEAVYKDVKVGTKWVVDTPGYWE